MKSRKSISIRSFALWFCCLYSNVFACGEYNEPPCATPGHYGCQNRLEANPNYSGRCMIVGIDEWPTYEIQGSSKQDDLNMKLDMDSRNLDKTIIVDTNTRFKNGRYIYVLRVKDGKLILRSYDRDKSIDIGYYLPRSSAFFQLDYFAYRSSKNYILEIKKMNGPYQEPSYTTEYYGTCNPSSVLDCKNYSWCECNYQHVRHSQLNGTTLKDPSTGFNNSDAWDPVYCAGELRVHNNKIDRINNESGHFKPNAICTQKIIEVFRVLGLDNQLSPNIGSHNGQYYDPGTKTYNIENDANPIFLCSEYPFDVILNNKTVCVLGHDTKNRTGDRICLYTVQDVYWVPGTCGEKTRTEL